MNSPSKMEFYKNSSLMQKSCYLIDQELKARTASAIEQRTRLSAIPVKKSLDDFDICSHTPQLAANGMKIYPATGHMEFYGGAETGMPLCIPD